MDKKDKKYIEREAALTEFAKICDICMALMARPTCGECSVADTVRKIKRIPAADVVPVVRCGECANKFVWCGMFPDDGYCSVGERKDGDGE